MLKKSLVLEELLLRFNSLSLMNARYIAAFIVNAHNNWQRIPEGIFLEECIQGINDGLKTYDKTKGSLSNHLKHRIRYRIQHYYKTSVEYLHKDLEDENIDIALEIDLSDFSDAEIKALFNVLFEKPSNNDIETVKNIFNTQ